MAPKHHPSSTALHATATLGTGTLERIGDDVDWQTAAPGIGQHVSLAVAPRPVDGVGRGEVVEDPMVIPVALSDPDGDERAGAEPRELVAAPDNNAGAGGAVRVVAVGRRGCVTVDEVLLGDNGRFQVRVRDVHPLVQHGHADGGVAAVNGPGGPRGDVGATDPLRAVVEVGPPGWD